ncbi:MAG: hypothetical protein HY424_02520 [Candidatus Levybacteria bacterium]|nr:hypothetical protein [Candidatus Levybacteria bacterium]
MYNWSVDEKYIKKFPKQYKLWRLEQLLSYGLDGERLEKKEVADNWKYLRVRLDPKRREFIEFLLWPRQS